MSCVLCRLLCFPFVELVCFGLVVLVRLSLSYGVRHMHSIVPIVPYYLIELMLYHAIYVMLIFTILFSVSLILARYALSIKYSGCVDPSMCAMQSKALLLIAHI